MSPKRKAFKLPKAPEFSKYLSEIREDLSYEEIEFEETESEETSLKEYHIFHNKEKIGIYIISDDCLEYYGEIPGYINPVTSFKIIILEYKEGKRIDSHKIPFP